MYITISGNGLHKEITGLALDIDQSLGLLYQLLLCDDKLRRLPAGERNYRNWSKT